MLELQEYPNAADVALDRAARHAALMAKIEAEMVAKARHAAFAMIKRRARLFLDQPLRREAVAAGLWCASPECLIETGRTMLDNERKYPRRNYGFGGEVTSINASALIVLGRYNRMLWRAIQRGA
jgi:hypothetical protein